MNTNRARITTIFCLLLGVLLLAALACGGSNGEQPAAIEEPPDLAQLTIAAQSAQLTQMASQAQQPGSGAGATEPAQATEPPQAGAPTISALESTNCREGPLPDYPIIGALQVGQSSTVHGVNQNKDWWYIENPKKPGEFCWVWGVTTQVRGDTAALEVVQAPPPPETAAGECQPPYDIAPEGVSVVEDVWKGSGQNAQLDITQSVSIKPRCKGVKMTADLVLLTDDDQQVYTVSTSASSNSDGIVTIHFLTAPLGGMPAMPEWLEIYWNFDPAFGKSDGLLKMDGPVTPPP